MDEVTLRYGDGTLTFRKSRRFIGVKARPGAGRDALARLNPRLTAPDVSAKTLGGFELIDVDKLPQRGEVETTLDTLRQSAGITSGTHVYETSADEAPFVPTGQLFIEYVPSAPVEERQALLDELNLQIVEARPNGEMIVQVTPQSDNPLKVAARLQESPLIRIAEPDLATSGKLHAFTLPTDSRLIDQWHLNNTGFHRGTNVGFLKGADARVIAAWERGGSLGSPNVIVAVIDDGFDLSHPDLMGDWKVVAPKDFTRNSADPRPDPIFEDWHGTACAGVAVGNADGTGIVGTAPHCRFMPIRWSRGISDKSIEDWFGYAREQGASVISCSWGVDAKVFRLSTRMMRAIARCVTDGRNGLGCVVCFAAGNENRDVNSATSVAGFALHPDVIAVSACNSRDKRSSYSNFGKEIWVCAPSSGAGGWSITTADVTGQYSRGNQTFEAGYSPGAYTDEFGGTSSACPLVAGICALLISVDPTLTAVRIKDLLRRTSRQIGLADSYDASGHSAQFGYGCVDAAAAIDAVLGTTDSEEFWGKAGHNAVNRFAIPVLKGPLGTFYEQHTEFIEQHSMDADHAKQADRTEAPRHFLDLDAYGEYPFSELPRDRAKATARFSKKLIESRGILPWEASERFDELVQAWADGDGDAILMHSAWLGHYVGDAHVPFHTTENHDGQLTSQKGIHSYFETQLVQQHVSKDDIVPVFAQLQRRPVHELVFEWLLESYTYVQPLLDADRHARTPAGKRDLAKFAKVGKPIAVDRLTKAPSRLAALWQAAWVAAGKPNVPASEGAPVA